MNAKNGATLVLVQLGAIHLGDLSAGAGAGSVHVVAVVVVVVVVVVVAVPC